MLFPQFLFFIRFVMLIEPGFGGGGGGKQLSLKYLVVKNVDVDGVLVTFTIGLLQHTCIGPLPEVFGSVKLLFVACL
jgi:hypothetical protein